MQAEDATTGSSTVKAQSVAAGPNTGSTGGNIVYAAPRLGMKDKGRSKEPDATIESGHTYSELGVPRLKMPTVPAGTSQLPRRQPHRTKSTLSGSSNDNNQDRSRSLQAPSPPQAPPQLAASTNPLHPIPSVQPEKDDIRTTYHPKTGKPTVVKSFEQYGLDSKPPPRPHHPKPWLPFHSESEFSFAEIVHASSLSSGQIDALIKVVHQLMEEETEYFFVKNHNDLDKLWMDATNQYSPFQHKWMRVTYGKYSKSFDFWNRSLKDWATVILDDNYLGNIAEFESVRLDKFDGEDWVPFYHEPWTAKRMWAVQDDLPSNGRPLLITIYADKTKLSSFGTAKGHPIMARIDNLPSEILNGKGLGATQVVGWLPVFDEDPLEQGKPEYVNFKRAVYHKCLDHLFSTIATESTVGSIFNCGGTARLLYPFIFILAADYEEQCDMTLTRGVKSLFPCTVCTIPKDKLSELSVAYPRRTADDAIALYLKGKHARNKTALENLYKPKGLRFVKNAFWTVRFSDPHAAASFDELHNNCHGLGGKHAFKEVKRLIKALPGSGNREASLIGERFAAFPRWKDLHRFNESILTIHFTDGNEFRDIMKLFVYAAHNIIGHDEESLEYKMMCVFRKYVNMVMWEMLEVHTAKTIAAGRNAVQEFGKTINAYDDALSKSIPSYDDESSDEESDIGGEEGLEDVCGDSDDEDSSNEDGKNGGNTVDIESDGDSDSDDGRPDNNYKPTRKYMRKYNFPKLHNQTHAFDDIENKGVLKNFSTRLFEGRHKSLKKAYQSKTNFKQVAPQILKHKLESVVSQIIRDQITAVNVDEIEQQHLARERNNCDSNLDDDGGGGGDTRPGSLGSSKRDARTFGNIYLGSEVRKATSFGAVMEEHSAEPAFEDFDGRTIRRLVELMKRPDSPVKLTSDFKTLSLALLEHSNIITQYKLLDVTYESLVDWRAHTDTVRANPMFHHAERFDSVIIDNQPRNFFAQLLYIFTVKLDTDLHSGNQAVYIPLALVRPFAEDNRRPSQRDKDLRLLRLHPAPDNKPRVIPARSIIRGAFIVPEGEQRKSSLIVDVIDSDMFLRMQEIVVPSRSRANDNPFLIEPESDSSDTSDTSPKKYPVQFHHAEAEDFEKALRKAQKEIADLHKKYTVAYNQNQELRHQLEIHAHEAASRQLEPKKKGKAKAKLCETDDNEPTDEERLEALKPCFRQVVVLFNPTFSNVRAVLGPPPQRDPLLPAVRFDKDPKKHPSYEEILLAELYVTIPKDDRDLVLHRDFPELCYDTMKNMKSSLIEVLRGAAPHIFGGEAKVYQTKYDRSQVPSCVALVSWAKKPNHIDKFAPILFPDSMRGRAAPNGQLRRIFQSRELFLAIKVVLFGPASLSGKKTSGPKALGELWEITEVEQLPVNVIPSFAVLGANTKTNWRHLLEFYMREFWQIQVHYDTQYQRIMELFQKVVFSDRSATARDDEEDLGNLDDYDDILDDIEESSLSESESVNERTASPAPSTPFITRPGTPVMPPATPFTTFATPFAPESFPEDFVSLEVSTPLHIPPSLRLPVTPSAKRRKAIPRPKKSVQMASDKQLSIEAEHRSTPELPVPPPPPKPQPRPRAQQIAPAAPSTPAPTTITAPVNQPRARKLSTAPAALADSLTAPTAPIIIPPPDRQAKGRKQSRAAEVAGPAPKPSNLPQLSALVAAPSTALPPAKQARGRKAGKAPSAPSDPAPIPSNPSPEESTEPPVPTAAPTTILPLTKQPRGRKVGKAPAVRADPAPNPSNLAKKQGSIENVTKRARFSSDVQSAAPDINETGAEQEVDPRRRRSARNQN
ncbi:hypothetical protein DXG01_003456 [Tephrocybe rancida]|nr:hypothetical protein DXG01_003456 [Tephrocybe rancida]